MQLETGSRLLMIGDSITDCGRDYNLPPAAGNSFGEGYVNLINGCLTGLMPESKIMVINKGISGNTILDLRRRWKEDVLDLKPDYVSVMIGVNDVWRHFDSILQQMEQVDLGTFKNTYRELIENTRPKVKNMILLSPFMLEENREDNMRKMLDQYTKAVQELADEYGLLFVDVQAKMDQFLTHLSSYMLAGDRVHPNTAGHMIIAKAFLDAVSFSWEK